MSRPSGNKFADFFPTAPSVLQQRKASKTVLQKTRSEAREEPSEDAPSEKVSARSSASGEESHVLRQTPQTENTKPECVSMNQDESEPFTGDLLNGVGSASSTSTASSVFSSANLNSAMALSNGIHLHAMTPLTNADSSPPPKMISPTNEPDVRVGNATMTADSTSAGPTLSPQRTPPAARKRARERGYVVKGSKVVYDPDLDKKVNAKDRKKMKAQFTDFGTRAEDEIPPPDPRLTIPNYMRGAAGKQKSKFRPSPYSLRPWPYDAATSIGMAPPTTVVATGFDPMAPVSQISALFSSFGEISEINNRTDPTTGRFLGICSIRYKDCKSFRGGAPLLAVNAAKRAYTEGKKGQRIGTSAIRIDIDREGAIVKKLIERAIASQRKEAAVPESPKPPATVKTEGPPPTAPKGPSGRPSIRPPPPTLIPHHTLYAAAPKPERPPKPAVPSLVETTPILPQLKREPYVFIAHCYVPVLSTTIPHLKKRLKMYDWTDVRCDETGYFITFENSKRGEIEAKRVYDGCHMNALFTYVMNMELQQYGNPNLERSPTPDKTQPQPVQVVVPRVDNKRLKRERDLDLEEEKRQRARDMDPSRAVLQLVIQEVRDKLMEDVRSRIAAPALYDYLDPDKHIEKRRRLGIEDPQGGRRQGVIHTDATPSAGTPDSRAELSMKGRQPLRNKNLNVLSLPRINKNRTGLEQGMSGFRDERRKGPAPRAYIRPLFHQLAQFHEESDSDDEQRTSLTRDTEDLETRPPSRMSMTSISDDEDELLRKATKKRMHDREDSEMPDSIIKEEPDAPAKTSAEDLIIAKLERSIYEMSPSSRKRKRLVKELEARKRQKEDDELFGIGKFEIGREDSVDIKISEADTPSNLEATPDIESDAPKALLKKPRPKKKTKKQIAEERAALRQEQMEAEATEIVDEVLEFAEEEEKQAELEERRPVVEWGVSTLEAERTVDDDLKIIPDINGWQGSLYDDEDIQLLIEVTRGKVPAPVGNLTAWTWKQKELRNIKRYHSSDSIDSETGIEGYYIPNPTGSARTEPIRKILEAEKSKYLPHRLKVQRAREQREAEATRDPKAAAARVAAEAAKNLAKASSRGKRVEDRRAVKEIDMQRDLLQSINGDADVLRFNQLKKRKKPVKFARSAIHNWGLYSLERIQASEMIIEYVGEKVRQEIADLREIKYTQSGIGSSYLFRIDEGSVVDATKKGGIARFINHSCMPNCTAKIIRVDGTKRIVIYALRDIEKGKFSRTSFVVEGERRANIPS
jgi:[histone H3]-lysine4 N-trimethyltransferase SETD1